MDNSLQAIILGMSRASTMPELLAFEDVQEAQRLAALGSI
jgi:hypothetical protein